MIKSLRVGLVLSLVFLSACGGSGGGTTTPPPNQSPTAQAPTDFSAIEETSVNLNGASSQDSDGTISSYSWVQTSGSPTVALTGATSTMASFTAPQVTVNTELTFELTVTDNDGASATDSVIVTITPDQPPVAVAPADFQAIEASSVTLDGSASSDDIGVTSYLWEQTSGVAVTLSNANSVMASFTAPPVAPGSTEILAFNLTVADAGGASVTDTVVVTIIEQPSSVLLSGKITFDLIGHTAANGLDYNSITQAVVRGATIELLDAGNNSILDSGTTDANGDYSFSVIPGLNYVLRVKAELLKTITSPTWNFTVVDNTNNQALYAMDSSTISPSANNITLNLNASSGWTGTAYTNPRVAAPFAILDDMYQSKEKILSVDAVVDMASLKLNWSVNNVAVPPTANAGKEVGNISTSHFDGTEIFILGDANADTDEYDDHVIIHEWGHYFEDKFSRSDSVGGAHSGGDKLDPRVALGEGFGNALSAIVTDDSFYRDSFGTNQSQGFSINIESNPITNKGWFSESSVQSLLYDIYDASDDGADNLSLGFAPIYAALINGQRTTEAFTTIFSLATEIKEESSSNAVAIDALLTSQSIIATDQYGLSETNNGGDARNLPIFKNLPTDGTTVEICSFQINGQYNKLGNRQFLKFEVVNAGNYLFTATGQSTGDDPDLYVYKQGVRTFRSEQNGNESTTQNLIAGEYVMDIYEFVNIQGATQKDTCIDVTMSPN